MNRRTWWLLDIPLLGTYVSIGCLQPPTDPVGKQMAVISLAETDTSSKISANVFTSQEKSELISLYAGDDGVTEPDIQNVIALIKNISTPILSQNIGILPNRNTQIALFGAQDGYLSAVKQAFGTKDAPRIEQQTSGFTLRSTVYVPLYKYEDDALLANTLTHELTHATLNEVGVGEQLPTWVSEGFAWDDGVQAENKLDPVEGKEMLSVLSRQMNTAKQNGTFISISKNPSVLPENPTYNTEYEDYLIVNALIGHFGITQFRQFLFDIPRKGLDLSFEQHFSTSLAAFASVIY